MPQIAKFALFYLRNFHIFTIVSAGTINNFILTVFANYLKFMRSFRKCTASGICQNRIKPAAGKYFFVRILSSLIIFFKICLIRVKAVKIFHQKFASSKQTRFGSRLVAELGLDLINVFGQILI